MLRWLQSIRADLAIVLIALALMMANAGAVIRFICDLVGVP